MTAPLALGLDLGTGGARAVVARADGALVAAADVAIDTSSAPVQPGWHEQDPEDWWRAAQQAVAAALAELTGDERRAIRALCVDGTSGTVVGVDGQGSVTTPALMYNDGRSVDAARELEQVAQRATGRPHGLTAAYGISKLRWLELHAPAEFKATHRFAHQADFIAGRLTGRFGVSDYSNALKTGFDLESEAWPAWLDGFPQLRDRLPAIVAPGEPLAPIDPGVARSLGLAESTQVVAGATDGTTAFLASGASRRGDDNTTLGTTLVFKRIAAAPVRDSDGLLYCHRLPGGVWLPGAASNVGGDWIRKGFRGRDLAALDREAGGRLPTDHLAYPLCVRGERFPFRAVEAEGFVEPAAEEPGVDYAAKLQGTALVERLAYEVLDQSAPSSGDVFATGGGSASDAWLQLRADVTGRTYHRPAHPDSAFGSAILAHAGGLGRDLWATSRSMVRIVDTFRPSPSNRARYGEYYRDFRALLEQRGYLQKRSSE